MGSIIFDMELTEEDMELIAGGGHVKIKGQFRVGKLILIFHGSNFYQYIRYCR